MADLGDACRLFGVPWAMLSHWAIVPFPLQRESPLMQSQTDRLVKHHAGHLAQEQVAPWGGDPKQSPGSGLSESDS
jgi:hypothetical protein